MQYITKYQAEKIGLNGIHAKAHQLLNSLKFLDGKENTALKKEYMTLFLEQEQKNKQKKILSC